LESRDLPQSPARRSDGRDVRCLIRAAVVVARRFFVVGWNITDAGS
jgi:hypothetical protein